MNLMMTINKKLNVYEGYLSLENQKIIEKLDPNISLKEAEDYVMKKHKDKFVSVGYGRPRIFCVTHFEYNRRLSSGN